MAPISFKLPIGAKRQVTIPSKAMELLSLQQGDDLLLEIDGEYAVLHPAVSVPRSELPEELRNKFLSRRGAKSTDIPLETLLAELEPRVADGKEPVRTAANPHAAPELSSASVPRVISRKKGLRAITVAGGTEQVAAAAKA